ncbi:MAG TPA: hypothetical protein V6C72_11725 [Chroococcales cyanobacterium]
MSLRNSFQDSADSTASRLESAARNNDQNGYSNVMSEVNDYRATHSNAQSSDFMKEVTNKLIADNALPAVSLFEAKNDMNQIDVSGDGNIQRGELAAYERTNDVNDLQKTLLDNVSSNFDNVSQSGDSWIGKLFDTRNDINSDDLDQGIQTSNRESAGTSALNSLFTKNDQGVSLYDRLKDENGDIPNGAIDQFLAMDKANPNALGLSDSDRDALKYLDSQKSVWSSILGTADFSQSELQDMSDNNGAVGSPALPTWQNADRDGDGVGNGNGNGDVDGNGDRNREGSPFDQYESTNAQPSYYYPNGYPMNADSTNEYPDTGSPTSYDAEQDPEIREALTVQPGQSYSQSAEKLLALAGVTDPSAQQLRTLTTELWQADGEREAGGLTVDQVLALSQKIMNNPDLQDLFARR